jgi:serine/threonine protein kinase
MIEQIGKYRIDSVLGTGAMGVVYKAYDSNIARIVALKTIRAELLRDHQEVEIVARFKNEAQASGRLMHPNIVAVYDYGETSEATYIAMEFVEGASLSSMLIAGEPMDVNATFLCMSQLLRALDYAHVRGVVHRDIKPANLLITSEGQVKITDFGIARIESSTLTQIGSVIGTPSYMSPEQFLGESVDGRTDVFSAGIVLYQLLTGSRPFVGSASVVMQQILNQMPKSPTELNPALSEAFDHIIRRALAKRAADRYSSAQDFLDALTEAQLEHTGGVAPTEEDNERTILAFQRPQTNSDNQRGLQESSQRGVQARSASQVDQAVFRAEPSTLSIATVTPWKIEVQADLQSALSMQVGPVAKLLIKNAASQAVDLDDLCNKLLPHISTEAGRAQFLENIRAIKRKLGISTIGSAMGTKLPMATNLNSASGIGQATATATSSTQLQLDPGMLESTELKLTPYIGPIAKVLVKRTAKGTANRHDFFRILSENLTTEQDRVRFLRDVGEL